MNNDKEQKINNPHFNGQREWMERYGDLIKQKRNWQIVAFLCLFITLFCVMGLTYIGGQNKFIPYVVEKDRLGRTLAAGVAKEVDLKDVNVIKSDLAGFIVNWRSIWGDIPAQRKFIFDAYKYIKHGSLAYATVSKEYKENEPFQRLQSERIKVDVRSVLPISPNNWQVEWIETKTDKSGKLLGVSNFKGLFIIEQINPSTAAAIIDNPLGNFITDINYQKIL